MFTRKETRSTRIRDDRSTEAENVARCLGGEYSSLTNYWHRPLTRSQTDRNQGKASVMLDRSDTESGSNSRPCSPSASRKTALSRRPSLLVVKKRKSTPRSHNNSKRITGSIPSKRNTSRDQRAHASTLAGMSTPRRCNMLGRNRSEGELLYLGTKKEHPPWMPGGSVTNHSPLVLVRGGGVLTRKREVEVNNTLPKPEGESNVGGRRNWEQVDRSKLNAFNQAVRDEDVDAIQKLSKNSHGFITGISGQRALVSCARAGATRVLRALLTAGVHPDAPAMRDLREEDGYSPLHAAVHHGHLAAMDALLKGGAYVDTTTISGLTPLHLAALHDRADCCVVLLSAGADPSAEDAQGRTPLALASAFQCAAACSVFEVFWAGGIAGFVKDC